MNPFLLLLGGAAAIALASGGSSKPSKYYVASLGTLPPPPPKDGVSFTFGPQPHPDAPESDDAGRYFAFWGASFQEGFESWHEAKLARISSQANGTLVVNVWASLEGNASQCSAWQLRVPIVDGRYMGESIATANAKCPPGSTPVLTGLPLRGEPPKLKEPAVSVEQRGPDLWLLWSVTATGEQVDDNVGFSPEDQGATGFYVDVLWVFEP